MQSPRLQFTLLALLMVIRISVVSSASQKLQIEGTTLVLESDGTIIDEDELVIFYEKETFIILSKTEKWIPASTLTPSESSGTMETYIVSDNGELLEEKDSTNIPTNSLPSSTNYEITWKNFIIPIDKFPSDVMVEIEKPVPLEILKTNGEHARTWLERRWRIQTQVIHIVVNEMRHIKTKIPISAFKIIANKLSERYPIFRDIDSDNVVIGDRCFTLTMKLIKRNNYLNRPFKRKSTTAGKIPGKSSKKIANITCDCSNWDPELNEEIVDEENLKNSLNVITETDKNFHQYLEDSYSIIRMAINSNEPLNKILVQWPILQKSKNAFYWHFQNLTKVDLTMLGMKINAKANNIIEFGIKNKLYHADNNIEAGFAVLQIFAKYFKEDIENFIFETKDVQESLEEVLHLLKVYSPCIIKIDLYFPQSNFTLRLPYLARRGSFNPEIKLIGLRTLRNDSSTPENVKYEIFPQEKFVIYQKNTGNLVLRSLPKNGAVSAVVRAIDKEFGEAVLEIKVQPVLVKTINCTDYVQDICFWNTSKYRIYENQPVTMIGTFGPEVYSSLCPEFRVAYELLNGSEYFHIVDGKLYANASLDRDTIGPPKGPGPRTKIEVTCIIWDERTGLQHTHTNVLSVDILDEDDNPPIVQGNTSIVVQFQGFKEGDKWVNRLVDGNNIVLKDADVVTSNRYSVRLLGDTYNALNMTYEIMPIEHALYPNQAPYTAILPVIYGRKTLLPESPYRVVLQITDESLREGYGPNSINVSLTFNGPVDQTPSTTLPSTATRTSFSYPNSVKIARISPKYLRVAKPSSKPHPSIAFILHGSSAFNVTRQDGIVYVSDETKLRSERDVIQLKLKWSGADSNMTVLQVNLIEVLSSKIDTCEQSIQEEKRSCANAESREDCEKFCGIGSGVLSNGSFVSRCMWRGNKSNNRSSVAQMSEYYSTCSPDLTHCPDNECDELERSDPRICPQDCTVESDVHFAHMNKDGRGIKSGLGICACTDLEQCTCGIDSFRHEGNVSKEDRLKKSRNQRNETGTPGARKVASSGPCGPTCMIGVIGASLFVLIVILGSFVMWRYRMAAKDARRECKHRVDDAANGIGILPSDYIDRGDGLVISLDTFAATNRLLPKTPPDPKWEFPRSLLKIEQVLGEGEFGRVLRAKAMNIGGIPGATTVAVKTLKEDACASELADLLSEYQLLKEAQHPNVIRLLGACTTPPGAPVYLIIEFAEFGSLRNYLRRSRHLESEDRVPGGTASLLSASAINASEESQCTDNNASNYTITPRDILSFAWQISKGMTYLADIKLVHRDLAARNVLLATGKVCKISDFGLTRDVYEDDAYLKRSKGRVPVKWMAPESLADHVYTSKSDVWSFGVLLWELVTLGSSPYPGVDVHNLYNLLKAGYRMEKPFNCSQQLYKLMVSCWHQEPAMRPSFKELTMQWERMLEDGVEYLDLNPRAVHNQAYFASLQALDSPNGNQQMSNGIANPVKTDIVNYLGRISSEPVTKCDKVDKLRAFWQPSVASFPEESVKSPYVNDRSESLNANHYESPIKLRNVSVTSNSENDLRTPPNERPQSYIDMQGRKPAETEDLLVFSSMDDDRSDNNATN